MTVQLDALQQEVAAIPDVVQSVTTLLNGIEQRLAEVDAAEDAAVQAQIDAIRNDIHSNVRTLAEAVAARTPAAPETTGGPADTGTLGGGVGMGGGGTAQPPEQPATGTPSEPAPSGGGGSETGGSTGAPAGGTGEPGTAGEGTPPPA